MVKEVSIAGPNEPDRRRERSNRTRARIVDAATRLLVEHGYVATTIEAVAEAAGVAVQTVYYVFGTKPHLLAAVLDAQIAGDVQPIPVLERPWIDALAAAPNGATAVELLIDGATAIVARSSPVYEVVRRASADPEVGALLDRNRSSRRVDQRRLIDLLARSGHLRADVSMETAADVFYAVMNEEVFQLLVADCGWDIARFRRWSTEVMTQQLVGSD